MDSSARYEMEGRGGTFNTRVLSNAGRTARASS